MQTMLVGLQKLAIIAAACIALLGAPRAYAASIYANGKGASVGGALWAKRDAPNAPLVYQVQPSRWSLPLLARLKAGGFGFIRLVATPAPLMMTDTAARDRAIAHVGTLVGQANAAGLSVVLDLHFWPTDTPLWQDNVMPDAALRARLIDGQVALARHLAGMRGAKVALELLNEPPCFVGKVQYDWAGPQRLMVARIRAVAPRLPLVLTGCRGLPDRLTALDPTPYRGDANIYWTFHYYAPSPFIGQES